MSSSIIVCQIAVARMKKGEKNDSKWWKTIYLPDNEAACASLFFKKPLHFSWNQLRSDANSFDNEDNKLLLLYIYFPVCFLFSFLLFSVCLPNEQNSDGALVERVDAYQHKLPILESLSAITHASLLLSPRKNQLTNDKRRRKEAKKNLISSRLTLLSIIQSLLINLRGIVSSNVSKEGPLPLSPLSSFATPFQLENLTKFLLYNKDGDASPGLAPSWMHGVTSLLFCQSCSIFSFAWRPHSTVRRQTARNIQQLPGSINTGYQSPKPFLTLLS